MVVYLTLTLMEDFGVRLRLMKIWTMLVEVDIGATVSHHVLKQG